MKNYWDGDVPETPEEKAKRLKVKVIPRKSSLERDPETNPVVAVCGECGISIHRVMGYACGNMHCPLKEDAK